MRVISLSLFAVLALCAPSFAAEETGLYAPPPPADAAYVRVIGAGAMASLGSTTMSVPNNTIFEGGAGTYNIITQGSYELDGVKVEPKAGHYYSLVTKPAPKLLEDPTASDPAKAMLVFYNLTSKADLSLKTSDGKTEIVGATAAGALGSRSVNAIKVGFALVQAGSAVAMLPAMQLERGQAYSLIAQEADGQLALTLVQNTVALPQ